MSASQILLWAEWPRSPCQGGPVREQPLGRGGCFHASWHACNPEAPRPALAGQPCADLTAHPWRAELGVHPRGAVGLAAPEVNLADLLREGGVLDAPFGGRPASPSVVAAFGHSQNPAQHCHRVIGPLLRSMSLKELTDPRSLPWRRRPLLFGGSLSPGGGSSPHA